MEERVWLDKEEGKAKAEAFLKEFNALLIKYKAEMECRKYDNEPIVVYFDDCAATVDLGNWTRGADDDGKVVE